MTNLLLAAALWLSSLLTPGDSLCNSTIDIALSELSSAWRGQPYRLEVRELSNLSPEGFSVSVTPDSVVISSPSPAGLLYGAYDLLRRQALGPIPLGTYSDAPLIPLRMLDHWDNLDGTIERGYAGASLWQWDSLPSVVSDKYTTYARANASIGINATVLNNVNASPQILSSEYLDKVRALADVFRPYNIRVFLSINFASPIVLSSLPTADPMDEAVENWWKTKVEEIYSLIPDFGGFLVKANSEGQPGPCDYGRTHAQGANMLAAALAPHGGMVLWRAFVYSPTDADRAKQAYLEFQPLDGEFLPNVVIQTKNGPIDFQPREPYSPLFTALRATRQAAELQITQEYLGHANHLLYQAPLWKEFFSFVPADSLSAIAGVANTGDGPHWCGNSFAPSNWYAFGRLAWNPSLSSQSILNEWTCLTFPRGREIVAQGIFDKIMLNTRETLVNYMMPLGLSGLFTWGHHYGPEPWCDIPSAREDWLPRYYHRADSLGVGFDRTHLSGSDATSQYPDSLARLYDSIELCPREYLLWFHHVPWTYTLRDGRTLWDTLCLTYQQGVDEVRQMQREWTDLRTLLPHEAYLEGERMLRTQLSDARWWRDAVLLYFQQFSRLPFPDGMEEPRHHLEDLMQVSLDISNFESPSSELLDEKR